MGQVYMKKYTVTENIKLLDLFNTEHEFLPKLMSPDFYEGDSKFNKNDFTPKSLALPNLSKFKCLYCLREQKLINPNFKDSKYCKLKVFERGIRKDCPVCSKSYKQDNHYFYKHIHNCRIKYPNKWNEFDKSNHIECKERNKYEYKYGRDMNEYLHSENIKELHAQRLYISDLIYEFEKVIKQPPSMEDLLTAFIDVVSQKRNNIIINNIVLDYYSTNDKCQGEIFDIYKKLKINLLTIDILLYKLYKTGYYIQNYIRIYGTGKKKNVFINLFGYTTQYRDHMYKLHSLGCVHSYRLDFLNKKRFITDILGKIKTITDMTTLFKSFLYILLPNIDEKNILDIITSYWSYPINF